MVAACTAGKGIGKVASFVGKPRIFFAPRKLPCSYTIYIYRSQTKSDGYKGHACLYNVKASSIYYYVLIIIM